MQTQVDSKAHFTTAPSYLHLVSHSLVGSGLVGLFFANDAFLPFLLTHFALQ